MEPDVWFARYDEKLRDAAARAEKANQALQSVGGSATSRDGDVTVRVSASGALSDLILRPGAGNVDPEQLARVILEASRQARREVDAQVVDVMATFAGRDPSDDPSGDRSDDEYFANPPDVIT